MTILLAVANPPYRSNIVALLINPLVLAALFQTTLRLPLLSSKSGAPQPHGKHLAAHQHRRYRLAAMQDTVYKICGREEWTEAEAAGHYPGNADDTRDGFIHLSARDQVTGTLDKHFPGRTDLLLVAIDARKLGTVLKWEPSRGGALFPHLYGSLPLTAVIDVSDIGPS